MTYVMTDDKFIGMAKRAASVKTLYVRGCFGAPMTDYNKRRYINGYLYNKGPERQKLINGASPDVFGFDCCNLIDGILWGWIGDVHDIYGGARYKSNGVPDFDDSSVMDYCTEVSDDFTTIVPGEVLHIPGHVGIYIGDGLAIECTARWKDGVQITSVYNLGPSSKNVGRVWAEHGKLQWIQYKAPEPSPAPVKLPTYELHVDQVRKGSEGPSVILLQRLLNDWLASGDTVLLEDGIAGNKTIAALTEYQITAGLVSDGICGTKTWSSLLGIEVKMDA